MWLAAGPSDLLGEGGRVGVFVILDGSGAIFTIVVEVYEYRDENVLALCLDGEYYSVPRFHKASLLYTTKAPPAVGSIPMSVWRNKWPGHAGRGRNTHRSASRRHTP